MDKAREILEELRMVLAGRSGIVDSLLPPILFVLLNAIAGTASNIPFFMAIDKARFRKVVTPGDQLRIEVSVLKLRSRSVKLAARALVDGAVASEAELMCMITDHKAEA